MRSLRYPLAWFTGGMILVGLLLLFTLMPTFGAPMVTVNDKIAHGAYFVILMIWFCGIFETRHAPIVGMALLLLGILIEVLQRQIGYRSAELMDGIANLIGIALGWFAASAGLNRWTQRVESMFESRSL